MYVVVSRAGNVSVMVVVPDVGAVPEFDTVMVYVAPVWPWTKSPERSPQRDDQMERRGAIAVVRGASVLGSRLRHG